MIKIFYNKYDWGEFENVDKAINYIKNTFKEIDQLDNNPYVEEKDNELILYHPSCDHKRVFNVVKEENLYV